MDFYKDWIKHLPRGFRVSVADEVGWCYDVTNENIDSIPGMDLVPDRIEFDIILRTVTFFVSDVKDLEDV